MISKEKSKAKDSKKESNSTEDAKSWSLFQGDTELGKVSPKLFQKINEILNGPTYAIVSTLILLYTLFSDDVRQIFFPASADLTFTILTLLCMIYYMIEIIVFSLVQVPPFLSQKDYFLGYYFWLDLVSTLTMAFDLSWITQYLTGGGKDAANISQISRASRAARLGTRTVKLIRLIRMVKILKQMKNLSNDIVDKQKKKKKAKKSERMSRMEKITSIRNVERINSFRNMEKLPSKRWSVITDVQCIGVETKPIHVSAKKMSLLSLSMLPYHNQDKIVDSESESHKSGENISIKNGISNKIQEDMVEPTNQHMVVPVFDEVREEIVED